MSGGSAHTELLFCRHVNHPAVRVFPRGNVLDGGILDAIGERVAAAQSCSRRLKLGGNGPVQDGVKAGVEGRREHTSAAGWRIALETVARPRRR